jgi:hypothetical protein
MSNKAAKNIASILYNRLGSDTLNALYNSMRREVYGIPGKSIPLKDILDELAEHKGAVDPASADDDTF